MKIGLPWFGPKTGFGWGWTPVTWQGWAVTVLFLICFLGICHAPPFKHRMLAAIVMLAGYGATVIATGTKPGGSIF